MAHPGAASALYAALGARLGAKPTFARPLGAYLQLDAEAPTARHRLELGGASAYALPAAWLALGLGLSLQVF